MELEMNSEKTIENVMNDHETVLAESFFIQEQDFANSMNHIVEPFLDKIKKYGTFNGVNNDLIYYEGYPVENPKAVIVISHGYCESIVKYHEWIYYFVKNNYSVYGVDHRGHGRSVRYTNEIDGVSVPNFSYYVDDLKLLIEKVIKVHEGDSVPLYLYAHSMGGCIGTLFLERYPNYFKAAVLNAPMLQINTGFFPERISRHVSQVMNRIGRKKAYIIGQPHFKENASLKISGTRSKERFDYYHQLRLKDDYLKTSRGTFEWLEQSYLAISDALNLKNVKSVKIPVLLFQADHDIFVKSDGQNVFASNAENCKLIKIPDSHHEIYFERNVIIEPYFTQVLKFFESI